MNRQLLINYLTFPKNPMFLGIRTIEKIVYNDKNVEMTRGLMGLFSDLSF